MLTRSSASCAILRSLDARRVVTTSYAALLIEEGAQVEVAMPQPVQLSSHSETRVLTMRRLGELTGLVVIPGKQPRRRVQRQRQQEACDAWTRKRRLRRRRARRRRRPRRARTQGWRAC